MKKKKKILLGTLFGFPVYVEVDERLCTKDLEKTVKKYMAEMSEPLQKVDPMLAKACGMETITILKPKRRF